MAAVIVSKIGIVALGLIAVASAILMLAGIFTDNVNLRSIGLFTNGLIRFYALLGGWLLNGFIPVSWMSPAALLVITLYLWWKVKPRAGRK